MFRNNKFFSGNRVVTANSIQIGSVVIAIGVVVGLCAAALRLRGSGDAREPREPREPWSVTRSSPTERSRSQTQTRRRAYSVRPGTMKH